MSMPFRFTRNLVASKNYRFFSLVWIQKLVMQFIAYLISNIFSCAVVQIEKKQYDKILSYIEQGKREGATLLTGGKPLEKAGFYIEPTIFTDVTVSTFYFSTVAGVWLCQRISYCSLHRMT